MARIPLKNAPRGLRTLVTATVDGPSPVMAATSGETCAWCRRPIRQFDRRVGAYCSHTCEQRERAYHAEERRSQQRALRDSERDRAARARLEEHQRRERTHGDARADSRTDAAAASPSVAPSRRTAAPASSLASRAARDTHTPYTPRI